jgi:hypothetical protein
MNEEREPNSEEAIDPPVTDGGGTKAAVRIDAPNDEAGAEKAIDPPSSDGGT